MPEMRKEAKEIAKKQTTKQVTKQMNAVTQSMMIGFEKQEDMLRNLLEKKPERNDASDEMWQEQGVPIHPDRYTVSMFVNSSGSTILDAYAKYTKDSSPANAETLLKKVKGIKTAMKHVVNYATEGKGKKSTIGKFFRELEKKADEESKEPEEESETEPAPKKRKVKKEAQPKPDEGKEEDARHKEEIGSDNELSTSKLAQAADLIKRNLGKGGGAKFPPTSRLTVIYQPNRTKGRASTNLTSYQPLQTHPQSSQDTPITATPPPPSINKLEGKHP